MIYNHKSKDIVQDVIVECICPIIEDLANEFDALRRCESLAIYAPSPIAREILGRVLEEFNGVWVHEESHDELLYKDDNKVIITLCDDGMIFVESAYDSDGDIKRSESILNYVYDEFTNKEVEDISVDTFSVLVFGFKEDEIKDNAEKNTGLSTTSTATYLVNGRQTTKEDYEKAIKELEQKFQKYLDMFDEIVTAHS